ncbi:MAG: MFS transporter [Clostridia bacterium]|nr:MFS transporter [Clostridia bacterium]
MKNKKLMAFWGIIVLFYLAANFAHPVTPTLIVERGLDSSMFGVALAAMMTMNFLFAPFWGKLCGYIPTKKIMLIGCIGYSVGQAVFGMAQSEAVVIAGRMFAGIFTGGCFTAFSNYVINTSDLASRGSNLTTLITIQSVASACGYFVGGMLGMISVEAAFSAQVVLLALCGVLCTVLCLDDTPFKHKPEKALSARDVNPFSAFVSAKEFMTPMLAMIFIIIAISGIGLNSSEQCFNYFIKDQFGLGSQYNGTIKAVIAALILVLNSTVCVYLQKKTDINKTFLPVTLANGLIIGGFLVFKSPMPFFVTYVLASCVNALRTPLMQAMVAARSTPENSNAMMGFYQSMNSLGSIFGALFAGLIYAQNPYLPFILAFAAFAVTLVLAFVYVGKYKKEKQA